jgi:hypothetical protein
MCQRTLLRNVGQLTPPRRCGFGGSLCPLRD